MPEIVIGPVTGGAASSTAAGTITTGGNGASGVPDNIQASVPREATSGEATTGSVTSGAVTGGVTSGGMNAGGDGGNASTSDAEGGSSEGGNGGNSSAGAGRGGDGAIGGNGGNGGFASTGNAYGGDGGNATSLSINGVVDDVGSLYIIIDTDVDDDAFLAIGGSPASIASTSTASFDVDSDAGSSSDEIAGVRALPATGAGGPAARRAGCWRPLE